MFKYLRSRAFIINLFAVLVFFGIIIFLFFQWLGYYTNHNRYKEVPELKNLSIEQVSDLLKNAELRFQIIDSSLYNPSFDPRVVIDQTPGPKDKVKRNRKIYLTVNASEYRKIEIPNLVDITKREAESRLRALGFRLGKPIYRPFMGKDVVLGVNYNGVRIGDGDKLSVNSELTLVLGNGSGSGLNHDYSDVSSQVIEKLQEVNDSIN